MKTESFPRQHARTRRFTLGAPRSFTVSPDDRRVVFLRSSAGDDPVNGLWVLDLGTGVERLVADPGAFGDDHPELSPEERSRRERLRESGGGITSYATDASTTRAVLAMAGLLYVTDLTTPGSEPVAIAGSDGAFDPRLDPAGSRVAFARAGGIWVTDPEGADPTVLCDEPGDDAVSWGLAEFVAAEEMGRLRGFWWDPGGDRILVARVDTSEVERWHIAAPVSPWERPAEVRYPSAGTTNADVTLWLVGLDGHRVEVDWDRNRYEYLTRVVWSTGHDPLIAVQSRDQRAIVYLDVDPATGSTTRRMIDRRDDWVENVANAPAWAGDRLVTVADRGESRRLCLDGDAVTGSDLQVRAVVGADADRVRFLATDDPTQMHVHELSVSSGVVRRLTDEPGVHGAVAGTGAVVITSAGPGHDGTRVAVRREGHADVVVVTNAETPALVVTPEFAVLGDRKLNTATLLPGHASESPLPVLLDPYGGPHALRVQRARAAFGVPQWFADQGFAVVVVDGRGTPGRGPRWERAVAGDLAGPVLDDQIDALSALAARDERLDLDRVAIRGWSFGGYLAALAVLRRPDIFHAAVAGAPVTDWRLYDTHYTERYLGHPDAVPDVYEAHSLIPLAPALRRPLMLIHGLADDNVVAAHTLQLSRALLEAGRPHEVLPLSGVTHMTPEESVAENLLLLQVEFLRRSLPRHGPRE